MVRMPAAVFGDAAGDLTFGDEALRRGHFDPAGLEPALPEWVDDEWVALSSVLHRVGDLLRGLLRHGVLALGGHGGLPEPVDVVLTAPGHWGGPRRAVLERCLAQLCADGVASRHGIISSTDAILAGALTGRADLDLRKVVVVEQEADRLLARVVSEPALARGDGAGGIPFTVLDASGFGAGGPDAAALGNLIVRAAGPGLPASTVLIAPRGGPHPDARQWRHVPGRVLVLDSDCALRGAISRLRT